MKSKSEIVFDVVCKQMGVDRIKLSNDTNLFTDLGADSLDQVELIMELEEEFEILIEDAVAEKIRTIGQIIAAVEELTK